MRFPLLPYIFCLLTTSLLAQPAITIERVTSGFTNPVDIAHCGDDRLFIVEKLGRISIIDANKNKLATPFLDIVDSVATRGGEQGLLGLAFHPNYQNNGYFYVYFIEKATEKSRLYRYQVSNDPNVAVETSALLLLEITQPFANHNGGCLKFGKDGFLYISSGDGGSGGDPQNFAQNPMDFKGKMLRIDVDIQDAGKNYAIPTSNPFFNNPDTLPEIWSLGLRNPWRFSFDRLTGDMWIGDVGQGSREEINYEPENHPGGANYGWKCYEGDIEFNTTNCQPKPFYDAPIHAYQTTGSIGRSVTGGFVFRDELVPTLYGKYIYGDFVSGRIWAIDRDENNNWQNTELLDWNDGVLSAFGENRKGELFLANHGAGEIYQVVNVECAANYDLTMTDLPSKTYQATDFITSSGTVENSKFTAFVAAQSITLQSGFHAKSGSEFLAKIDSRVNCGTNSALVISSITKTSTPLNHPLSQIKVFPNPANQVLNIQLPKKKGKQPFKSNFQAITIVDDLGRIVQRLDPALETHQISLIDWKAGVYFVNALNETGETEVVKFLKLE